MYTANLQSKSFDKPNRQYILVVEFTDGTDSFTDTLRYGADFTFDQIRANIKQRLDLLNQGVAGEASIPTGAVDTASLPDNSPTQAELDAQAWIRDFGRLQNVQKLIDLGVLTGSETAVTNLKNKVQNNFKSAYINLF